MQVPNLQDVHSESGLVQKFYTDKDTGIVWVQQTLYLDYIKKELHSKQSHNDTKQEATQ